MKKKHVVIVDDYPDLVAALKIRCEQLGLGVTTVDNGAEAITTIARNPPDLVLLDINIPAGDGLSVCSLLASNARLAPIPVIILSGHSDEETIKRCEALGAHYVLKSGDVWEWLRPRICELLEIPCYGIDEVAAKHSPRLSPKVLVIDDDPDLGRALKIKLLAYSIEVLHANSGMKGYWTALKQRPNAIILDFNIPEGRGDYVLGRLKNHALTRDIPVFILTGQTRGGQTDFGLERDLMGMGAVKFLTKPLDFDLLLAELRVHLTLPWGVHSRALAAQAAVAP